MSELKRGTYVREPDGATLLFHSELTTWNFPVQGLKDFQSGKFRNSFNHFRLVMDEDEQESLTAYLGDNLKPGEYVEITT